VVFSENPKEFRKKCRTAGAKPAVYNCPLGGKSTSSRMAEHTGGFLLVSLSSSALFAQEQSPDFRDTGGGASERADRGPGYMDTVKDLY
jgi:hypothetical protein